MTQFKIRRRQAQLCLFAILIGGLASVVARLLLLSINFFTNLFYFQIFSLHEARPEPGHLGWISIFIPVIGGLIVGLLARFGSKAMREELYSLTPKSVEFSVKTIRP